MFISAFCFFSSSSPLFSNPQGVCEAGREWIFLKSLDSEFISLLFISRNKKLPELTMLVLIKNQSEPNPHLHGPQLGIILRNKSSIWMALITLSLIHHAVKINKIRRQWPPPFLPFHGTEKIIFHKPYDFMVSLFGALLHHSWCK